MQHVIRISARNAHVHRLKARVHARERAVMVCTEFGDRTHEAALPFGHVVCDVRHEISKRAVGFPHHTIFIVAVIGRL